MGHHRIHGEIPGFNVKDRPHLDASLPVNVEFQRTHLRTRKVSMRETALQLRGTWMVVHYKSQSQLIGEGIQRLGAAAKHGAASSIHTLEVVEEFGRGNATRDAKARTVGDRAVGNKDDAAVIVPDGLVASGNGSQRWKANQQRCNEAGRRSMTPKVQV